MGYKQRERKRRMKRVAATAAQRRARQGGTSAGAHWLTLVTEKAACNVCGGILRRGRECVYRHTPREILCVRCAEQQQLRFRPSLRWEQRRKKAA